MSKRLLVVDDEPDLLRAVAVCLHAEGYEVTTARSGAEALLRVAEMLPDLVISDIRMPGMDGYTLTRQLRALPRTGLIPIVFLTAKNQTSDRIEGFRSGVDVYLTKPFEPDELLAVVAGIMSRTQRTHAEIAQLLGESAITFQDDVLTDAEERIAAAVARGLSNKEIAGEMDISVRTVESHISHILAKKRFDNRIETHIADQLSGDSFAALVVAAVHQTQSAALAFGLVYAKKHFAWHSVESGDDSSLRNHPGKFLRARRDVGHNEVGVVIIHRKGAGYDHLARQIACLIQHVLYSRPVHCEQ